MKIAIAILVTGLLAGCGTLHHKEDYRSKVPITLPPSAEILLLRHQHASHIVNVDTLLFQRKNYADFLVASVTIHLTHGDFAGWFHQTYVFEKKLEKKDWSESKLYCFQNRDDLPVIMEYELLARPKNELRQYLKPAPIWK